MEQSESENEKEENGQADEGENVQADGSDVNNLDSLERVSPNAHEGRSRKWPYWMQDYVTGEGLSEEEEEEVHNLVMYMSAGDPTSFEEANESSR